ncbi:hypothetical protein EE612_033520, partial [Oryza sativa]
SPSPPPPPPPPPPPCTAAVQIIPSSAPTLPSLSLSLSPHRARTRHTHGAESSPPAIAAGIEGFFLRPR